MAGDRERIAGLAVAIQPTPGTYVNPTAAEMIPVETPDDGYDMISSDDPTLTGGIWATPRIFLGTRGRAGATARLRGPANDGATVPAANAWGIGRVLQAAGFTEIRQATAVTGTVAAGGTTSTIVLDASASSVDDFYKGMVIQHAGIGSGLRGHSMIRGYVGATKTATLAEVLAAPITSGTFTIPKQVLYALGDGTAIPLLSAKVWRGRRARGYKDCALSSFAINIPVANDQATDLPSVEFALMGVPDQNIDQTTPTLADSMLTPIPPAKAGKFALNGVKIGHQSIRLEFGLETGAPPNQNNDNGQESYEILSGTRTVSLDVNQQLVADLDLKTMADNQTVHPMLSMWGLGTFNRFGLMVPNQVLDPLSPAGRNGFVGMTGNANPMDVLRSVCLAVF